MFRKIKSSIYTKLCKHSFRYRLSVLIAHFIEVLGHPAYSLSIPLLSSYSLLSSLTHAHLRSSEFGDSNNSLGTPIQSLSIPPLAKGNFNSTIEVKHVCTACYLFLVHHTTVPESGFHSTLQGGSILFLCSSSDCFSLAVIKILCTL